MIRNYLLTTWRNLIKNKLNAIINLFGLIIAFVCCILLFLAVYYEFSFDGFHKDKASLYKVYDVSHAPDGDQKSGQMGYPAAAILKSEVQGIEETSGMMWGGSHIRYKSKEFEKEIRLVDNGFFNMFTFPVVAGANKNPLSEIGNVVLSKATAESIFGQENPIGKFIKVKISDTWQDLNVSAVVQDAPANSSITFDMLARIELRSDYAIMKNNWSERNHAVYIKTKHGFTQKQIEAGLREVVKKYHFTDDADFIKKGYHRDENGEVYSLKLLPFTNLHFDSELGLGATMNKSYLYLLVLIAVVTLVIACFNFINLTLSSAFTRAKEVGIRKTIGAGKMQIFFQLWSESFFLCLLSVLIAFVIALNVLTPFNNLFIEKLDIGLLFQPAVLLSVFAGILLVSFLAGGYPALIVSRFNPVAVLKGKLHLSRSSIFRNGLITFQFIMANALICGTIVIYRQFQHMRTAPLGFSQESVISIPVKNVVKGKSYIQELRNIFISQPQIVSITGSSINIGIGEDHGQSDRDIEFSYNGKQVQSDVLTVTYDYLKTLNIKTTAGRDFSVEYPSDTSTTVNNIIVTKNMAKQLGNGNLIGTSFYVDDSKIKWNIIGIIPDFHLYSINEKMAPLTLQMSKNDPLNYIFVRVKTDNPLFAMDLVKNAYKRIEPDDVFEPSYLTENTSRWYQKEQRLTIIFCSAAVIAICLSCLGLFAIVSLVVLQRRKEIGVRKVLGASTSSMFMLLSKSFLKLVIISCSIATPVAFYFLNKWLTGFIYRIDINYWLFLLTTLLTLFIAFVAISFQTLRSSMANPIKSLQTD